MTSYDMLFFYDSKNYHILSDIILKRHAMKKKWHDCDISFKTRFFPGAVGLYHRAKFTVQ